MDGSAQNRPFGLALDEPARKINPLPSFLPEGVDGQKSRPTVAGAVELEPGEQGASCAGGPDLLELAAQRAHTSRGAYVAAVLAVQRAGARR